MTRNPPRDRLAGQLGLDLEARRAEPHLLAEPPAEGPVAREQVRVPGADQQIGTPRGISRLPMPRVNVMAPAPGVGCRAPTVISAMPSSTGATSSGAASAGYVPSPSVSRTASILGERRERRPHRMAFTLFGHIHDPHAQPAGDVAGAVGRVIVEDDDLGSGRAARNAATTVAIAAASL